MFLILFYVGLGGVLIGRRVEMRWVMMRWGGEISFDRRRKIW